MISLVLNYDIIYVGMGITITITVKYKYLNFINKCIKFGQNQLGGHSVEHIPLPSRILSSDLCQKLINCYLAHSPYFLRISSKFHLFTAF